MSVFQLAFFGKELNAVGLGEVGAEVVRGAGLQSLAVLHHRLHGIGGARAGELFLVGLAPGQHRQGEHVLGKVAVHVQHQERLLLRFFGRCMDGVSLLPPELAGAQKRPCGLFPAHHRTPLVVLHRQIAPGLHPLGVHGAEKRLRGRADGQALGQHLVAALRHPGHFRREAFDVLGLLEQQALGDEHRHGHVLVPRGLEALVQLRLHALPQGVAVGLDDHAAAHGRVVHQVGLEDDIGIPLGKVLTAGRDVRHKFLLVVFLAHVLPSKKIPPPLHGRRSVRGTTVLCAQRP